MRRGEPAFWEEDPLETPDFDVDALFKTSRELLQKRERQNHQQRAQRLLGKLHLELQRTKQTTALAAKSPALDKRVQHHAASSALHPTGPRRHADSQGPRIARAPGGFMRRVADFLVSPKTFEQAFEPLIADLCAEWLQAVVAGRTAKARWIRCRYSAAFVTHLLALGGVSAAKLLERVWRLF